MINKLLVFLTIDGWGISSNIENNAIRKAKIDAFKDLIFNYPATAISSPGFSDSKNYSLLGLACSDYNNLSHLSLSKIISQSNLGQLKIARSENFPLLSVFFNNQDERLLLEDWLIVKEKKSLFNFLKVSDLEKNLIDKIKSKRYNFIFSNFSDISEEVLKGDFLSIVSAVEGVSKSLDKIAKTVLDLNGVLIISSTHGGAEDSYNIGTGLANKKKTNGLVPLLIIGKEYQGKNIGLKEAPNNDISLLNSQGSYLDIAPTILSILGLDIPREMEGKSFI